MTIGERLCFLRGKFDLSQDSAATKYGIPLGSWKKYEVGPSEPGSGALRKLAEGGVSVNWLLTGEGEMLLSHAAMDMKVNKQCSINTSEFIRVLETLSKQDYDLVTFTSFGYVKFGYYASLIYNRVISVSEEIRGSELKSAIDELGFILLDQSVLGTEIAVANIKESKVFTDESVESLQEVIDDLNEQLGSVKGKFRYQALSPCSQLETEFLGGAVLSKI